MPAGNRPDVAPTSIVLLVSMTAFTYVIGDLHGRLDLLLDAVLAIEAHSAGRRRQIVTLGDYVDRGPDSRGVVDFLIENAARLNIFCLKGNHEAMMLAALQGGDLAALSRWMFHGGEETMRSYGWTGAQAPNPSLVPQAHLDWMQGLALMARDRQRLYVHAGIYPDRPIAEQDEAACLWIRERFLESELGGIDLHVVHGHTPRWRGKSVAADVERLPHRTNLDTGAYYTGVLAIGVFADDAPGGPVELLQVGVISAAEEAAQRQTPQQSGPRPKPAGASARIWRRLWRGTRREDDGQP
jgi:serine/threonine protein phosphatase 1